MIYDDAAWHYRGPFPPQLPCEAGATSPGMFLAWAILNGLGSETHAGTHREKLVQRYYYPGQFLVAVCNEKLSETDLSEEGNAFARGYLPEDYRKDYEQVLVTGTEGFYFVEDSWENYEKIRPTLDRRLKRWRKQRG